MKNPVYIQEADIQIKTGDLSIMYDILYNASLDDQVEAAEKAFLQKADIYIQAPLTGHTVVEGVVYDCLEAYYAKVLEQFESSIPDGVRKTRRVRFAMDDLSFVGNKYGPFVSKYAGIIFLAAVWAVYNAAIPDENEYTRFLNETHRASISHGIQNATKRYLAEYCHKQAL